MAKQNFSHIHGDTLTRFSEMKFEDKAGNPIDLSGSSLSFNLKRKLSDVSFIFDLPLIVSNPTGGLAGLTISKEDMANLDFASYDYNLVWIDSEGVKKTFLEGKMTNVHTDCNISISSDVTAVLQNEIIEVVVNGQGPAGQGVLAGGTTGQLLAKKSDDDYDTEWLPAGAGTGDMLSTNNLSDLTSFSTARQNLGLVIGTDVQAYSLILQNTTASFTVSISNQILVNNAKISYPVADSNKLAGIEPNAKDDQTGAEMVLNINAEPNANILTDAEKAKLASLESSHFLGEYISLVALQTAHPTAIIGDYANVNAGAGTDVIRYIWDNDDTSWIASGSGTLMTDEQVKIAYENNPDTNAFSDSEKTNLGNQSGINTGDETNTTIKTKLGKATSVVDGYLGATDFANFVSKLDDVIAGTNVTIDNTDPLNPVINSQDTIYDDSDVLKDSDTVSPVTGINKIITQADMTGGGDMSSSVYDSIINNNKHGLGTGCLEGLTLSVNADPTKFNVSAGTALFVNDYSDRDNPTVENITFPGAVALTPIVADGIITMRLLKTGVIEQSITPLTPTERRDKAILGGLNVQGGVVLFAVNTKILASDLGATQGDLLLTLGVLNKKGNKFSANGVNLKLNRSLGNSFVFGASEVSKSDPNFIYSLESLSTTFINIYRDGAGGTSQQAPTTDIIPGLYDDGTGTLATVPVNKFTNQWVIFFPSANLTIVAYGQATYNSLDEAISGIDTEEPILESTNFGLDGAQVRAVISVKNNATDLSSISQAKISNAPGLFGLLNSTGTGSGVGFQNLQGVYNASVTPEIITDLIRGALTLQDGTGNNNNNVFEGKNNTGTTTFSVDGNGNIVSNNLSGNNTGDQDLSGLQLTSEKNAINGYPGLGGDGKINPLQLPALAISETFVVNSELAQLALIVQEGDVAVRTDESKSYIALNDTNATMSDWQELLTPVSPVQSVAGKVGVVTLDKNDVGLGNVDNTSDLLKPISTATQLSLNGKVSLSLSQTITGIKTFSSSPIVPAPTADLQAATKKYVDDNAGGGASELEKITEGANTGWRILGRDPANYGDIGQDAVDLSYSSGASTTIGAIGDYSFVNGFNNSAVGELSYCEGQLNTASGILSHCEGAGNIAKNTGSHVQGLFNIGTSLDTIHETGIGTSTSSRKNAFEIYTNGRVKAPELSLALHDDPRSLCTKEYTDSLITGFIGKETAGSVSVANNIWTGTEAEYTALATKNADTLYFRTV